MIIIDKAKKEDIKYIHDISKELNIKNIEDKSKGVLLRIIPLEVIENTIDNFIVAKNNNKVVGFLWFNTEYPMDMIDDCILQGNIDNCVYSEQIAVKEDYQGLGIGRKLYAYLKTLYPNNGILVFVDASPKSNKFSFNFHTNIGFSTVGTFEKEYFCGFENFTSFLLKMDNL